VQRTKQGARIALGRLTAVFRCICAPMTVYSQRAMMANTIITMTIIK